MPVKLTRRMKAFHAAVPNAKMQSRPQLKQLRRMPQVSSAVSRPPYATSEEYVRLANENIRMTHHRQLPGETSTPECSSHNECRQRLRPTCVLLPVPKTHVLSPLGEATASALNRIGQRIGSSSARDRLKKTRAAYKEKLTLVKAKLKQRRHFRGRLTQRYVVPTQPPSSAEIRMVVPPPPSAEHSPRRRRREDVNEEDVEDVEDVEEQQLHHTNSQPTVHQVPTLKHPTLKRRSSAPSTLSQRRGFLPPPLNAFVYPFGKHSNDKEKTSERP